MKTINQIRRIQPAPVAHEFIRFSGGLDTTTPPISTDPGYFRSGQNVEVNLHGGYSTVRGYERHDGRPSPSAATYYQIGVTITGAIAVGDTVTGVTSGATGYVIVVGADFIAVTKMTGAFVSGEVLNVAAAPQATTTSVVIEGGASTNLLNAQYNNLAADVYRADIAAVPGSGSVTGVVRYNDVTYAWRNNAGGTATDIYKSSSSGWVNVPLFYEWPFEQGMTAAPAEGSQVSQGAVTATVKRVALESGSWLAGTAVGKLIITAPSGGSLVYGQIAGDPTVTAANGTVWTQRTSASDLNWLGVAYGSGLFVAISSPSAQIMTSADGVTWALRSAASYENWQGITYANGLFVAVSGSIITSQVMTSPDGKNWTSRTGAVSRNWTSVAYGAGLFVAVASSGTGNRVMSSPDGITWTARVSAADDGWSSVCFGNNLFVAVSTTGTVMTSPDGITWTIRTAAAANPWSSVAYGAGLFVAVGASATDNRVMTSPDGITWTSRTGVANNNWSAITYSAGVFVAVATSGAGNRAMTSPDGITWTGRTSAADNQWRAVVAAAGVFVAVSDSGTGNRVMTSPYSENTFALATGTATQITLQPFGKYEFVVANYTGSTTTKRVYGASRVDRGFEFDGTVLVPITTGMAADTPEHVYSHKNHLFFSFGGSVQHSSVGFPYQWSPITGAGELAMGDTVTGFIAQPGTQTSGALTIFTRNRTSILYGSSSADWNLVTYREELGSIGYTVQDVGFTIFLDDQGVVSLQTVQEFGNFAHAALSNRPKNYVTERRGLAISSCISRDKGQYRLFFSDGSALYVTIGAGRNGATVTGMTPILLTNPVVCSHSSEDSDGTEIILFGATNGMVYQMEKGTSFDGGAIDWYFNLAYNFSKSPRTLKRYRDAMIEVSGNGYAEFNFTYDLGYASTDVSQPGNQNTVTNFSFAQWDAFTWDQFTWDGVTLSPNIVYLEGEAENISMIFSGSSDYYAPITLSGVVVAYSPRRSLRQ